MSNQIICCNSF
uniref:BLTX301 n=1 Tax=Nephila pilipes TaxID=299642 RepID=A0A076L271_NEPPI|nr:BLTX301 [Nephila pilipes]